MYVHLRVCYLFRSHKSQRLIFVVTRNDIMFKKNAINLICNHLLLRSCLHPTKS